MRLYFRDYYFTSEYKSTTSELNNFNEASNLIVKDDPTNMIHGDWEDTTLTTSIATNGQRTTSLLSNSASDQGWVHGPFDSTTKRLQRKYIGVQLHSLVRVQMRLWIHGSWCADNYLAIDIAGDTIFTHRCDNVFFFE